MRNTLTGVRAPRYSRMVEDQFSAPIPKNTSHVNHSFCTSFYSNRLCEGYSLKYVLSGKERYEVNGQKYNVTNGNFLVVSHGSMCRFIVEEKQTVEGLCIYLSSDQVASVWQTLQQRNEKLLDVSEFSPVGMPAFYENVFSTKYSGKLNALIKQVHATVKAPDFAEPDLHEELFYELAEGLCLLQQGALAQLQQLPAIKKATREELYRRLLKARDYLHDNITEPLNLGQLAKEASLSEYHFLRQFKAVFGATPYQYLLQLRLQLARHLLQTRGMAIAEVAQACGFKEVQAFSKIFRKNTGLAPSVFQVGLQNV